MKFCLAILFFFAETSVSSASDLTISFTRDEAQQILTLMDNAAKAGGLQAAKQLLPIADKILDADRADQVKEHDDKIKEKAAKKNTEKGVEP